MQSLFGCSLVKVNLTLVPVSSPPITRSRAIWVSCGLIAVVVAILIIVAFLHGAQSTTCDGMLVRTTVLDLVRKNSPLPPNTDYELDSIRKTGEDTAANEVSCEAKVFGTFNNTPYSSAPLTYTVTRHADGQVAVGVQGISGLHFP